jgi:lipoprotein-anchoring transpeptidase ErfK/SrfK
MLLVFFVTVLSASSDLSADSVRSAAKPESAHSDTTIASLPTPTIVAPRQPATEVVLPIRPVTSIARLPGQPAASPVAQASTRIAVTSPSDLTNATAEVVQQAGMVVDADFASKPSALPDAVAAAVAGDVVAKPVASVASAERAPAPAKAPVLAPADAVAKAAAPGSAVTTRRVDPRTVVSVRSSESIEPLYAVPIPAAGVRVPRPAAADSIVVYKRERTLILYNRGVPVKSYFIALGSQPVGDKQRKGDQRTPEGLFYINAHNPASKFHLALRISYPSDAHRSRAAQLGVDPGGDIMIHGLPKDYSEAGKAQSQNDWTNGCVAVSNQEIEEIWHAVPDGTPVQIKP